MAICYEHLKQAWTWPTAISKRPGSATLNNPEVQRSMAGYYREDGKLRRGNRSSEVHP